MARRSRDEAAAHLAVAELTSAPAGSLLVLEDSTDLVEQTARAQGARVECWGRRRIGAVLWPERREVGAGFDTVALRLPKAREELEMLAHLAAGSLVAGGRLLVYGANDEGIRSAGRTLEPVFGRVGTLSTGGHARLLGAARPAQLGDLKLDLDDWFTSQPLELPWHPQPVAWTSCPGIFAHGRLDAGTELLARTLTLSPPTLRGDARVLDWGSGSGLLADAVRSWNARAELTLADLDQLALEAARRNVPESVCVHSDGWQGLLDHEPWQLVIANPPYHRGKSESLDEVAALLAGLDAGLQRGGELRMVVQRRLPIEALVDRVRRRAETLVDEGPFRVWRITS